jgi:putative ABC transport system permease protein
MGLAVRNLFQNRTRLALSLAGVALSVLLILLLGGLFSGLMQQIAVYPNHTPGSVVVAQTGVSNFLGATSVLPPGIAETVAKTDGVARVVPILSQFITLDLHTTKLPVYLVGYDQTLGGGPWRLAQGREPQTDDELVFDRVLAERHGVKLGDTIDVMGHAFHVTGLSDGTASWMTSYLFMRASAAEALLLAPGATSFLLVTPTAGVSPTVLRDRLQPVPGTSVLLKQQLIHNDQQLLAGVFSGPLRLMSTIAFVVGTLVVGLVIYTATVERQREYGVLKAIGAGSGRLYRLVLTQALIAAGIGALLGVGLTLAAGRLIMMLRPQFLITLDPAAVLRAVVVGLVIALFAALFPARVVARLAPADVFRR